MENEIDVMEEERNARNAKEDVPVRVVRLSKTYHQYPWKSTKDLKAVDEISFTIPKGEIFCLLGPNGGNISVVFGNKKTK